MVGLSRVDLRGTSQRVGAVPERWIPGMETNRVQ
jgi:ribosomal protein S2